MAYSMLVIIGIWNAHLVNVNWWNIATYSCEGQKYKYKISFL